jgi:DNA-binding NtrC family response regulator
MRILVLSDDPETIRQIDANTLKEDHDVLFFRDDKNPLQVMSFVCSNHPKALIVDDDYLKPNSVEVLKAIKKVHPGLAVIFVSSQVSVDLGREISQLGIHYFAQKPLQDNELKDSIQSLIKI